MLSLSQATGYAIQALSCLEENGAAWTQGKDVAGQTDAPRRYLTQILHVLGKAGLLLTKRGYKGGYRLVRPAKTISILEVVRAVDGEDCVGRCLLGRAVCSDLRACPTHEFWKVEKVKIEKCLAGISLANVAAFERKRAKSSKKPGGAIGCKPSPRRDRGVHLNNASHEPQTRRR